MNLLNTSGFAKVMELNAKRQKLKKEESKAKKAESRKKMIRDASLAKGKVRVILDETPQVLANRLRANKWYENNKEKRAEMNKRFYEKKKAEANEKIAMALKQIESTEKNIDFL